MSQLNNPVTYTTPETAIILGKHYPISDNFEYIRYDGEDLLIQRDMGGNFYIMTRGWIKYVSLPITID